MRTRILISIVLTWTVLVLVGLRLVARPQLLIDPPVMLYVLALPMLAGLASAGPGGLLDALRDALSADAVDLPAERRSASTSTLRSLGGAAMAAGMLGFFGALIATFNAMASSGGQASPHDLLAGLPGMVLAPIYGMALKAFLFDALADALEGAEPGLGADLG